LGFWIFPTNESKIGTVNIQQKKRQSKKLLALFFPMHKARQK